MSESLDYSEQVKQFTQLYLNNVYYQIRIWEADEWKTAFCTRYSHFKYQMMIFNLSNIPASFQRYIN